MEVKFIHMSDTHLFAKNYVSEGKEYNANDLFEASIDKIIQKHNDAQFLLISGDLVDDGSVESYEHFKNIIENKWDKPVYLCLGNHDNRENFNKVFLNSDTDKPYCYSQILPGGEACLITLDTGRFNRRMGNIDDEQLSWLKSELGKTTLPIILMLHHPPFMGIDLEKFKFQLNNSAELYDIIKVSNIAAVCAGHLHGAYSYKWEDSPVSIVESSAFGLNFTEENTTQITGERGYNLCILNGGKMIVRKMKF